MASTTRTRILTSEKLGEFSRFRLTSIQTRFGSVEWCLTDAEIEDPETGLPAIVAQGTEAQCRAKVIAVEATYPAAWVL